ncbi:MAG: ABC transporter substrate-binding protein [Chlorobia bacterium]|nr:ABC transporter substrate-binding protein [Fimbriimonadaceae bacterium]
MHRAFVLSLFVAAVTIGCKPGAERIAFPVRPKHYQTVASLSPGSTEVLASMAYAVKLVGRTAACNYPPSAATAEVVAQVKPDYEKIKSLNPGLVVYDASIYNDQDIAQIKALGIDTFEFKADTVDQYSDEIRKLGALAGVEMEASTYADKMLQERKAAAAETLSTVPKVALILPGKSGEHYIAGIKSFHADVIRASGGEPVGPDVNRYVPINAEALIKLNPDMIVTAGEPNALTSDPRLKSLPAIAKLRVRGIPQDLATRKGFRVEKEINMMHRSIMDMAGSK